MGNIRRIRKNLAPKIAMSNAHITINGCQVFLGHPNPQRATDSAKAFKKFFNMTMIRANCINLGDMYRMSFLVREKLMSGESICN